MNSTLFAPGKYRASIKNYGWTVANTGTPQFFVSVLLLGQYDQNGELRDCPRLERTIYRAISTKSPEARQICADMLQADLAAIGVSVTDESQLDPQQPGAVNLFENEIDVHMAFEPYAGKAAERWAIRPAGRRKLEIKDLQNKLGGSLFGKSDNGPPTPAVPPNDDDTPL